LSNFFGDPIWRIAPMIGMTNVINERRYDDAECGADDHAIRQLSAYPDGAPVLAFGPRMVCTGFGMIGGDARPNSISTEHLPLVLEVGLRLSDDPALLFELGLVDFAAR
jgi:hypothetical protein